MLHGFLADVWRVVVENAEINKSHIPAEGGPANAPIGLC